MRADGPHQLATGTNTTMNDEGRNSGQFEGSQTKPPGSAGGCDKQDKPDNKKSECSTKQDMNDSNEALEDTRRATIVEPDSNGGGGGEEDEAAELGDEVEEDERRGAAAAADDDDDVSSRSSTGLAQSRFSMMKSSNSEPDDGSDRTTGSIDRSLFIGNKLAEELKRLREQRAKRLSRNRLNKKRKRRRQASSGGGGSSSKKNLVKMTQTRQSSSSTQGYDGLTTGATTDSSLVTMMNPLSSGGGVGGGSSLKQRLPNPLHLSSAVQRLIMSKLNPSNYHHQQQQQQHQQRQNHQNQQAMIHNSQKIAAASEQSASIMNQLPNMEFLQPSSDFRASEKRRPEFGAASSSSSIGYGQGEVGPLGGGGDSDTFAVASGGGGGNRPLSSGLLANGNRVVPIEIIGLDPAVTNSIIYGEVPPSSANGYGVGSVDGPSGEVLVATNPLQQTMQMTRGLRNSDPLATNAKSLNANSPSILHVHHFHPSENKLANEAEQQQQQQAQSHNNSGESSQQQQADEAPGGNAADGQAEEQAGAGGQKQQQQQQQLFVNENGQLVYMSVQDKTPGVESNSNHPDEQQSGEQQPQQANDNGPGEQQQEQPNPEQHEAAGIVADQETGRPQASGDNQHQHQQIYVLQPSRNVVPIPMHSSHEAKAAAASRPSMRAQNLASIHNGLRTTNDDSMGPADDRHTGKMLMVSYRPSGSAADPAAQEPANGLRGAYNEGQESSISQKEQRHTTQSHPAIRSNGPPILQASQTSNSSSSSGSSSNSTSNHRLQMSLSELMRHMNLTTSQIESIVLPEQQQQQQQPTKITTANLYNFGRPNRGGSDDESYSKQYFSSSLVPVTAAETGKQPLAASNVVSMMDNFPLQTRPLLVDNSSNDLYNGGAETGDGGGADFWRQTPNSNWFSAFSSNQLSRKPSLALGVLAHNGSLNHHHPPHQHHHYQLQQQQLQLQPPKQTTDSLVDTPTLFNSLLSLGDRLQRQQQQSPGGRPLLASSDANMLAPAASGNLTTVNLLTNSELLNLLNELKKSQPANGSMGDSPSTSDLHANVVDAAAAAKGATIGAGPRLVATELKQANASTTNQSPLRNSKSQLPNTNPHHANNVPSLQANHEKHTGRASSSFGSISNRNREKPATTHRELMNSQPAPAGGGAEQPAVIGELDLSGSSSSSSDTSSNGISSIAMAFIFVISLVTLAIIAASLIYRHRRRSMGRCSNLAGRSRLNLTQRTKHFVRSNFVSPNDVTSIKSINLSAGSSTTTKTTTTATNGSGKSGGGSSNSSRRRLDPTGGRLDRANGAHVVASGPADRYTANKSFGQCLSTFNGHATGLDGGGGGKQQTPYQMDGAAGGCGGGGLDESAAIKTLNTRLQKPSYLKALITTPGASRKQQASANNEQQQQPAPPPLPTTMAADLAGPSSHYLDVKQRGDYKKKKTKQQQHSPQLTNRRCDHQPLNYGQAPGHKRLDEQQQQQHHTTMSRRLPTIHSMGNGNDPDDGSQGAAKLHHSCSVSQNNNNNISRKQLAMEGGGASREGKLFNHLPLSRHIVSPPNGQLLSGALCKLSPDLNAHRL